MTDIRNDQAVHSLIKYLIWPTLENSTENAYKTEWFKSFIINTDTGSSKLKTYANIKTFYELQKYLQEPNWKKSSLNFRLVLTISIFVSTIITNLSKLQLIKEPVHTVIIV